MARKKPTNLFPVKDLVQANLVLGEIALLKRNVEAINHDLNDEIDRLKAEAEAKAAPLAARLASLENGLLAYAEHNKDELFAKKRSKGLDFGELGYRRSTEIKPRPKHTLAMVLGKIKDLGFSAAIRTTETVNKDELATWTDERLELVGARRVKKDTFWYEIKAEVITGEAA